MKEIPTRTRRLETMSVTRRDIFGPPADLGVKANQVDGQSPLAPRSGVINGDASDVTDQGGVGTADRRNALQEEFRSAQAAASGISAAGAAGEVVAPAGQVETTGQVQPGGPGAVVAASGGVVTREDGGDDPAGGAYGKAIS
jgi:hypothetical protein